MYFMAWPMEEKLSHVIILVIANKIAFFYYRSPLHTAKTPLVFNFQKKEVSTNEYDTFLV